MNGFSQIVLATILSLGAALAGATELRPSPPAGPFKFVAEDKTAQCLAQCKAAFSSCSNGGTTNIPKCTKERADCMNKC